MHPTPTAQQPAQRLPIRHHGGVAITGAQQPWREFDIDRGFPEMSDGVAEAGGPLDAPIYVPRGGAEVFQAAYEGAEPMVFWCESRGAL